MNAVLVLFALILIPVVFTSGSGKVPAFHQRRTVAILSNSPLFARISDDDIFCVCVFLARFQGSCIGPTGQTRWILNFLSILDQVYGINWSDATICADRLYIANEKFKEFVRLNKRFPSSLETFLSGDRYLLNNLESTLVVGSHQRIGTILIKEAFATLQMNGASNVDADALLAGYHSSSTVSTPELALTIASDLESLFRSTLVHFHFLAEVVAIAAGEANLTLSNTNLKPLDQILGAIFSNNARLNAFLFGDTLRSPNTDHSPYQKQLIFGTVDQYLQTQEFTSKQEEVYCVLAVRYGTVEDLGKIRLPSFNRLIRVNYTMDGNVDMVTFISRIWDREDALAAFKVLGQNIELSTRQDLGLAILACDPEKFFGCYAPASLKTSWFKLFLYECVRFRETVNRNIFEAKLFEFMLAQCNSGTYSTDYTTELLVAVINLAASRNRRDVAEALCQHGRARPNLFKVISSAMSKGKIGYTGPLAEVYLEHFHLNANIPDAILGKIVTSAIVRNEQRLLELLRSQVEPARYLELLVRVDFPASRIYIDRYCRLFARQGTNESCQIDPSILVGRELERIHRDSYRDDWDLENVPVPRQRSIIGNLGFGF